jgi:8-oxo-dGTP diphosphatase
MIIGQKAIIKKDGKYLVVHKSLTEPRFPGYWDFPGGCLEKNEGGKDAIKREVFEETHLEVLPLEVVRKIKLEVNGCVVEYRVWEVKLLSGEIKLSHEHTEFKWLEKKELLKLKVQPYIREFFG